MNNEQMDYGMKLLTQADYALHKCVEWQNEQNLLSPALREKLKAARRHVEAVYVRFQEECKEELRRQRERAEEERKAKEKARMEEERRRKEAIRAAQERQKARFKETYGVDWETASKVLDTFGKAFGVNLLPYMDNM